MKITHFLAALLCLAPIPGVADTVAHFSEKSYQTTWCSAHDGVMEVILQDGTRADCMTDDHAIEVDFGYKFYEAVGQSLWYSLQTNERAGIVLILEGATDYKYWVRLNTLIGHFDLPIDTWAVGAGAP